MKAALMLLVVGATARDSPPQIIKDKARLIELQTGSINRFVLECAANGEPAPSYHWYKDGEEVAEMEGVKRVDGVLQSQLDFSSPAEHHAGYYHCEADNAFGRARSSQSRVVLELPEEVEGLSAPKFTRSPQTEIQTLGSRVELKCSAEGSPQPEISWMKNGLEVASDEGTLVIPSLSQGDVANYACNASNVAGYVYKNVVVYILTVPAKIKEGPKETLVASKGKDVVLPCKAEGYPVPRITWSKDGGVVEEGAGEKYRIDSGFLKILKAGTADQGSYACTADNNQGTDTVEGRLVVQDKTEIITGPTDMDVEVEQAVLELECEVVADQSEGQELSVTWKKNNQELESEGFLASDRVVQTANHSLFIYDVQFSDSGLYTCVGGTNLADLDTMSGFLTVIGVPPSLTLGEVDTQRWEGDSVELECLLEHGMTEQGRPQIYWYKDNERVGRGGEDNVDARIEDDGQRLVIDRATTQHSGLWVCKAENSEGSDAKSVQLMVRRRTELAREPEDLEYITGREAIFQCVAVADPTLQQELSVVWQHDGQEVAVDCAYMCRDGLTCLPAEGVCNGVSECPMSESGPGGEDEERCDEGSGDYDATVGGDGSPCDLGTGSKFILADHSLLLCSPTKADLGSYSCLVSSPMGEALASQAAVLYLPTDFPWWIIFLIFAILTLLLCICIFVTCWRKRRRGGKGFYNPMDPENLKHNKSDIYYTTEDADSVMHEIDTSCSDLMEGSTTKTPIFTPKTLRNLSSTGSGVGSASSLLEDDEFLKRGMNEDGSFRERYAE